MSPSGLTRGSMVGASAVVGMNPRVHPEDDSKRKWSKEDPPEPAAPGKGRLQMSPSGLTRGSMVGASAVVGMDPRVEPEDDSKRKFCKEEHPEPAVHGKGRLQMSPSGLTRGSMVGASAVVGMDPRVEPEDDSKRKFCKEEHPEPAVHGKGRLQMSPSGLTRGSMVGASAVVGMDPRVEPEDDSKRKICKEAHPEPAVHGKGRLQMSPSGLTRGSMVGASAVVGMDPRGEPEDDSKRKFSKEEHPEPAGQSESGVQ